MKKYLLPENGNFYKANLHCHSNYSDGKLSPAELKELYRSRGYSIIAYTDHDIMIDHSDLTDDRFLALNGYEMEVYKPSHGEPFDDIPCCHICLIALEKDNLKQVCYHRSAYLFGNAPSHRSEVQFYEDEPDFVREYTPESINTMIKTGRDRGFFVTYNHPSWSLETYPEYTSYVGMNAMEIYNAASADGHLDYNPRVYDDMLRTGHRIYCIAADDNHNYGDINSKRYTSFKGATVIKADKLEYRTVTKALENGSFYSTLGPEIYELYFEDGKVHISCSDAESITFTTGSRRADIRWAPDGEVVNSAEFNVDPNGKYFRLTVSDYRGKVACTNAYFTDELFESN
ncbi:MAG: PHP domain-containing protein [Clostridia bacterium]|nr:PHP domain-containing protein [Clostridia bacterium]